MSSIVWCYIVVYIRHKIRRYDWSTHIRDCHEEERNFRDIWFCMLRVDKSFREIACHDRHNRRERDSSTPVEIRRIRITEEDRSIDRGYHLERDFNIEFERKSIGYRRFWVVLRVRVESVDWERSLEISNINLGLHFRLNVRFYSVLLHELNETIEINENKTNFVHLHSSNRWIIPSILSLSCSLAIETNNHKRKSNKTLSMFFFNYFSLFQILCTCVLLLFFLLLSLTIYE